MRSTDTPKRLRKRNRRVDHLNMLNGRKSPGNVCILQWGGKHEGAAGPGQSTRTAKEALVKAPSKHSNLILALHKDGPCLDIDDWVPLLTHLKANCHFIPRFERDTCTTDR